jgi:multidrug efflux pump subunit AcrB
VQIVASLRPGVAFSTAEDQIHQLPAFKNMPSTVKEQLSQDEEASQELFESFLVSMGAAVLLIYAVLVLLFVDFIQPLTIMVSLPLSITGALLGLVWTHQALGTMALIGILMLMGLVTKNAILLVDFCLMAMQAGLSRDLAVVQSGKARMRPILMTTFAMISGMVPVAFASGEQGPMAVAVIGGLLTSTLFTLVVVPVVFTLLDDVKQFFVRRFSTHVSVDRTGGSRTLAQSQPVATVHSPVPALHPSGGQSGWQPWRKRP